VSVCEWHSDARACVNGTASHTSRKLVSRVGLSSWKARCGEMIGVSFAERGQRPSTVGCYVDPRLSSNEFVPGIHIAQLSVISPDTPTSPVYPLLLDGMPHRRHLLLEGSLGVSERKGERRKMQVESRNSQRGRALAKSIQGIRHGNQVNQGLFCRTPEKNNRVRCGNLRESDRR
jgi:hypothetical protein